jgi:hypothetical protein
MVMLAFQVSMPTNDTNAWVWIAGVLVVALGALFLRYDGGQNKRAERCEKREDLVLEDNRAQAATIKEQSTTLLRVSTLTENAVEGIKVTHQKVDNLQRLLEERPTNARRS